jgi:translocation and assembly module TamB
MDLLTKRVRLTQGRLQLLGTLDPDIYLKADVDAQDGDILSVEIAGRSSAPELILSSQSGRPSEEVLAEVLFGKALEGLSTFQTIQLVNAFRTLGSPNPSFMERMRRMSGLDDFDITQDEQGDLSVSAGKYIRDNTYVEFEFGSGGKAETRLNLDLNRRTKTFISHDTNGDSQIGITFGQDYE